MRPLTQTPFRLMCNPRILRDADYGSAQLAVLNGASFAQAFDEITTWPGYAITPLHDLSGLAALAGIGALYYKDEGTRFSLGSFKALGGAYAVFRLLARELRARSGLVELRATDLASGRYAALTRNITVTCATDGNHGRSVAWGAQMFGCRCVIHVHETVSEARVHAIAAYGAEVWRHPGNYDDAVRAAARAAAERNWFVVSDTSYAGYLEVPRDVMQGYTLMVEEALTQLPVGKPPTHVFVQGGVGGMAAAVCGHLWERQGRTRPTLTVVEPVKAACLYESAVQGAVTIVHGNLDTIMAGLACGEPSLLAWQILDSGADAFMAIEDAAAAECMRLLAEGTGGDPAVVAGESAVAGLAGLLLALEDDAARPALKLGAHSRVLVFGTEGDTDPEQYQRIVGRSGAAIRAAAATHR